MILDYTESDCDGPGKPESEDRAEVAWWLPGSLLVTSPQRRQSRIVPPASPVARTEPSGENARVRTLPVWPTSVQRSRAGDRVPQLDGAVVVARGDRLPVGRVGHGPDRPGVPLQLVAERGLGRVGDVPDDHRAVAASRGQGPTVGREGDATESPPCVPRGYWRAPGRWPPPRASLSGPRRPTPGFDRRARRPGNGHRAGAES